MGFGMMGACCCGGGTPGLFILGGSVGSGNQNIYYDEIGDAYTAKTNMPHGDTRFGYFSILGLAYKCYGAGAFTDEYNPSTNAWTAKTNGNAPSTRQICASGVASDVGYIYGGISIGRIRDCDGYDPSGDTWTGKTDMPTPARNGHGGGAYNGKCYASGGFDGSTLVDMDEFDAAGDSWTSKTDLVAPARSAHAYFTISTKVYCAFGANSVGTPLQDCDEYDPGGDSWASKTNGPSPARYDLAGAERGGAAYCFGGTNSVFTSIQDADEYTPDAWVSNANGTAKDKHGTVNT